MKNIQSEIQEYLIDKGVITIEDITSIDKILLFPFFSKKKREDYRKRKKILRLKAEDIDFPLSVSDSSFIEIMHDFVKSQKFLFSKGCVPAGLAAPQLGISKNIITCKLDKRDVDDLKISADKTGHIYVTLINPVLEEKAGSGYLVRKETCLSASSTIRPFNKVKRCKEVEVSAFIMKEGQLVKVQFSAFNKAAALLQHEMDHLDGVMYYESDMLGSSLEKKVDFNKKVQT